MAGETRARCDRARQWASLRADGELSELEARMLDRHLTGCAACREWEASVLSSTALLREAPLELPSRRFELPRQGGRLRTRRTLAAAAVVAVVTAASVLGVILSDGGTPAELPPSPRFSLLPGDSSQLQKPPPADRPINRRPSPAEDAV